MSKTIQPKVLVSTGPDVYEDLIVNVAKYASEDTSKGSIEDRLTNLGFREGSTSINSTYIRSTTQNYVKRQGNYIIGKIIGAFLATSGLNIFTIGTIPENFRPKVQYGVGYVGIYNEANIKIAYARIATDGTISLQWPSGTTMSISDIEISFGYESNPI